jgi:Rieske Fe-S protein
MRATSTHWSRAKDPSAEEVFRVGGVDAIERRGGLTRRRFHSLVIAGAGACLFGCGSGVAGTVTPDATGQVRLTFASFPALANPAGSVVVDVTGRAPIIVIRTTVTDASAASATCTHAACLLDYVAPDQLLDCPCHHARFDLQGNVLGGPTSIPVPIYTAVLSADGITVALD